MLEGPGTRLQDVLEQARRRGFLGRGTPAEQHVAHARAWLQVLPVADEIVDLGSGGGVPGLVLAVLRPMSRGVLVEAAQRRCSFLEWALGELGVRHRWRVACGRAEHLAHEPAHRERYDGVVARGFGPPPVVAECASGFLRVGGWCSVSEPPGRAQGSPPERWSPEGLGRLGLRMGGPVPAPVSTVLLEKVSPLDGGLPRRTAALCKRPAW